jgi:predicted acyltransferase (DUF342 family)
MRITAFIATPLVACIGFAALAASPIAFGGNGRSLSAVNGSVTASAGETYNRLSTVNGDVHVGRGASADEAKTVNGEIVLDGDSKVGDASTVNGSVEIGEGAAVTRTATTVNGSVTLRNRAQVGGDVTTVSGDIELSGAEVAGRLEPRNGDIELADGAHVRGGIHVRKKNDSNWDWGNDRPVRVRICATCIVDGELRFDRPVELRVENGAKIGQVIGSEVTRR